VPLPEPSGYSGGAVLSKSAELEVPGLELALALARMSGLKALYARTARDFAQALDTQFDELESLLQGGAQKKALMLLHTLKGNAGTLGAPMLAQQAAQMEALCTSEAGLAQCSAQLDTLRALGASTRTALQQAVALLEPTMQKKATVDISPVDAPVAIAALRELGAMLLADNMEALQRYAELRASLAALPADFADAFDAALQDLELQQAHALCAGMLRQLQS
jgi:two-component system, sensor histidine kinase and response regulator